MTRPRDQRPNAPSDQPASEPRHPILRRSHPGAVNSRAAAAFETAQFALLRGDKAECLDALKRALDTQPDFADAHLWIARLSDDPAVKREHLSEIIARFPGHTDALRDLMVINGRLTPEEATRTHHHDDTPIQRIESPVKTTARALICPTCGGDLDYVRGERAEDGYVECRFCGYRAARAADQRVDDGGDVLTMALLERKARSLRWQIGGRLLHCNRCGAERTIPATTLSMRCPFCASTQVIVQDALASFQQPDGLIPFELTEDDAKQRIDARLGSFGERLKSIFDTNRVKAMTLEGLYLPFWVFDALIEVTQTRTYKQRARDYRAARSRPPERTQFRDACYNLFVPALSQPESAALAGLGGFSLDSAAGYQPKLLARHPAALYDIDVDRASLEARSESTRRMKQKHGEASALMEQDVTITVFAVPLQMTFRLFLAPVWIASLLEVDGDRRAAYVNGQTGAVAFGRTQK